MKETKRLTLAACLCAVAVAGSFFSFPMFGSKCAPVQHAVNLVAAVYLGPLWALGAAFVASLLRNLMGLGTLLAFPGSMIGALCAGLFYQMTRKLWGAWFGEVLGTGLLGGLCAYPVAVTFMGKVAGEISFYVYVWPFFLSTVVGATIAALMLIFLRRTEGAGRA